MSKQGRCVDCNGFAVKGKKRCNRCEKLKTQADKIFGLEKELKRLSKGMKTIQENADIFQERSIEYRKELEALKKVKVQKEKWPLELDIFPTSRYINKEVAKDILTLAAKYPAIINLKLKNRD